MKKLIPLLCSIALFFPLHTFASSLHEVVSTEKLSTSKPILAVDSNNIPHIVFTYYDKYKTTEFLVNAKRENGKWTTTTLDTKLKSNDWIPSFDIDSNNNTYYTYVDSKYYDLIYSYNINGTNNKEAILTGSDYYVGLETRIAHDNDDWPHILYYDLINGFLRYAHQSFLNNWEAETIGSMQITTWSASMTFDELNNPHIVYFDNKLWSLQHVYKQNGSWKKETIGKPGEVDQLECKMSSKGILHVAYRVLSSEKIWYAVKLTDAWTQETIGSGTSLSLMLQDSNPLVSFLDQDHNKFVLLEKQSSGSWKNTSLLDGISNVLSSSTILDKNGSPIAMYSTSSEINFLAPDGLREVVPSPTATTIIPTQTPMGTMYTSTPSPTQGTATNTTTPATATATIIGNNNYEASWVWQTKSDDPSGYFQAKPGETVTIDVVFKNTGKTTWSNSGADEVTVAVYKDTNVSSGPPRTCYSNPEKTCKWPGLFGSSYFYTTTWHSEYRISSLKESSVAPGENGTFNLSFAIPSNAPSGTYREDISVAHGPDWMSNTTNGDKLGIAHIWVGFTINNSATKLIDFSKPSDIDLFTIVDTGDKDKPSVWKVQDGKFMQASNIWGGTFGQPVMGKSFLGTMALLKEPGYSNFDMSVTVTNTDDDGMGVVFRADPNNFYRFFVIQDPKNGGPFAMLDKQTYKDGRKEFTAIKKADWKYEINTSYAIRIKTEGPHIQCWINNNQFFDITDDSLTQGLVGLYSYGSTGLSFDDVLIETLP